MVDIDKRLSPSPAKKKAPPKSSIADIIRGAVRQTNDYTGGNNPISTMLLGGTQDAASMAAADFQPQYDLLDKMRRQSTAKYGAAATDIGGLYDSLSNSIKGQESDIINDYQDTGKGIGSAFNSAINSTRTGFNQSSAALKEMLQRLGINQAAPDTMTKALGEKTFVEGILNAESQNSQNTNAQLGSNEVDYNRNRATDTKLAGTTAQGDIKRRLLEVLGGYDTKQLDLQGQESQAENSYSMAIQKMMQDSAQAQQANALAQARLAQTGAQNDQNNQFRQAQFQLDAAKLGQNADQFNANQASKPGPAVNPYQQLALSAKNLYHGNGDEAARNAANAVLDTLTRGFNGDHSFSGLSEFINALRGRNPRADDTSKLEQLAAEFYAKVAGGANNPLG